MYEYEQSAEDVKDNDTLGVTENPLTSLLRQDLALRRPRMQDGTVIKFLAAGRFKYAAIYIAAKRCWYLTGNNPVYGNVIPHDEFMDNILLDENCSNVQVATEWESVL